MPCDKHLSLRILQNCILNSYLLLMWYPKDGGTDTFHNIFNATFELEKCGLLDAEKKANGGCYCSYCFFLTGMYLLLFRFSLQLKITSINFRPLV